MQGLRYKCTVIVIDSTHVDLAASSWIFFFDQEFAILSWTYPGYVPEFFHRIGVDTLKWHFFCKEIYFFEWLYFNIYNIKMLLYNFLLRKGSSIKYVYNWWGGWGVIQNAYGCVQGEGIVMSHV